MGEGSAGRFCGKASTRGMVPCGLLGSVGFLAQGILYYLLMKPQTMQNNPNIPLIRKIFFFFFFFFWGGGGGLGCLSKTVVIVFRECVCAASCSPGLVLQGDGSLRMINLWEKDRQYSREA